MDLQRWLRAVRRRIRVRRATAWVLNAALVWSAASCALLLVARYVPLGWQHDAVVIAAAVAAATASAGGLLARLPLMMAARVADRELDARDRVATSLELQANGNGSVLSRPQIDATSEWLAGTSASQGAPMRADGRRMLATAIGAIAVLALAAWSNPMDAVVDQRRQAAAILREEARKIEKSAETVSETQASPEREVVVKELERLASKLEDARSIEEAIEELARTEGKLSELQRVDDLQAKTLLAGAERAVEEKPLADGTKGDLSSQLSQLAEMSQQLADSERAGAADRLQKISESLASADPELSAHLSDAADALRSKSGEKAALGRASSSSSEAKSKAQAQQQLAETRAAVGEARDRLAEQAAAQRPGQGGRPGQRPGDTPGQGGSEPGSGEGSAPGDGAGEGSSGAPGRQGPGQSQSAAPSGGQGGREGGTGGPDISQTKIYQPLARSGEGVSVDVEGDPSADGLQTTIGKQIGPTTRGDILVPYSQVYPAYSAKAARNVRVMPISASMRSFVRSYFASLDPAPPK